MQSFDIAEYLDMYPRYLLMEVGNTQSPAYKPALLSFHYSLHTGIFHSCPWSPTFMADFFLATRFLCNAHQQNHPRFIATAHPRHPWLLACCRMGACEGIVCGLLLAECANDSVMGLKKGGWAAFGVAIAGVWERDGGVGIWVGVG